MKKLQYSAGVKGIVILLQELFAVVLVICIVIVSVLLERGMLDVSDLNKKPFSKSAYFEKLFQEGATEVLSYAGLKEQFETDGVYNPEKLVNVNEYMKTGNVDADSRGNFVAEQEIVFGYTLQDIEDWSKGYTQQDSRVETNFSIEGDGSMIQYQTVLINESSVQESSINIQKLGDMAESLQENVITEVQHYYGGYYEIGMNTTEMIINTGTKVQNASEFEENTLAEEALSEEEALPEEEALLENSINKAIAGKLFELEGDELRVLLQDLELTSMSSEQDGSIIQEIYLPVAGNGILESFLSEKISLTQMQEAYAGLEYTLNQIGEQLSTYRRFVNQYDKSDTNLSYWIYSEGQSRPLSNIVNEGDGEELASFGKKQGSYFYYNEREIRLDTNINGMEELYYDVLDDIFTKKNRVILVAVDTDFPYEDDFNNAKTEYNKLQPWVTVSLTAAIIGIIECLFCLIYLSMAAGRKMTDDQIHLCWFDKIKTEFLALAFLFACIGTIFLYSEAVSRFGTKEIIGLMILLGGITFTAMGAFLSFYLSLVRRMKAGVMWSGSFTYWLWKSGGRVIRNWQSVTKVIIFFGIHMLACLLLGVFGLWSYGQLGYVPVLLLFLMVCSLEVSVFLRESIQRSTMMKGIKKIAGGDLEYKIDTMKLSGDNKSLGEVVNTIGEGLYHAVDDSMKNERLKADLITNVSHDIKTPLTSIINYVDLIKREDIPDERVQGYVQILDAKSQRLKQLTEDLVEASKVSSGNITLQMERINLVELVYQTGGEFIEKFEERDLTAVTKLPRKPVVILADGRRIWRVIENLYNNVEKYAMRNTRVYIDMEVLNDIVFFSIKNISAQALNIDASELTERFIRGDVSRSTEGSGLGLSIANNLTQLMDGTFDIYLDGDLFKVTITFPAIKEEQLGLENTETNSNMTQH